MNEELKKFLEDIYEIFGMEYKENDSKNLILYYLEEEIPEVTKKVLKYMKDNPYVTKLTKHRSDSTSWDKVNWRYRLIISGVPLRLYLTRLTKYTPRHTWKSDATELEILLYK